MSEVGKKIEIKLSDLEFHNITKAARSYQMSIQGFMYHCALKMTEHRLSQIKDQSPLVQVVKKGKENE